MYQRHNRGRGGGRGRGGVMRLTPRPVVDPQLQNTVDHLHKIWPISKKHYPFCEILYDQFRSCTNPFETAFLITSLCSDFGQSKRTTLAFAVMEVFSSWLKDQHNMMQLLTEEVKHQACTLLSSSNFRELSNLILDVSQLRNDTDLMIAHIESEVTKKKYKEACQLAHLLNLQDHFHVEKFVVPLILQDKLTVAEQFLEGSPQQQKQIVIILDNALGHYNVSEEMGVLAQRLGVVDVRYDKLQMKPLRKLLTRLIKKFGISNDLCPNLSQKQRAGGLKYLFYKRFVEKTIGEESWREMAHEAVESSPDLQLELVQKVASYGCIPEAVYWARQFQVPSDELPYEVKNMLLSTEDDRCSYVPYVEEVWENPEPTCSGPEEYHSLSLPMSRIFMVDTLQALKNLVVEDLKEVTIVGIDAEWKPYFGNKRTELALLQIATFNSIYLIDVLTLKTTITASHWTQFIDSLFLDDTILKLGFGLKTDLTAIANVFPNIGISLSSESGYFLDLHSLWRRLAIDYKFSFPFSGDDERGSGEGLTHLVYLCLGKPLNKDNQFSNWERRPLRESQMRYAALDAYCLLEVYQMLEQCCEERRIPFSYMCQNLNSRKQHQHHHHRRSKNASFLENEEQQEVATMSTTNSRPQIRARDARLVCDTMVQGLGKKLRHLGVDTYILESGEAHSHCARVAHRDNRFIVTRGSAYTQLVYEVAEGHICQVKSDQVDDQIKEVFAFFNIVGSHDDFFSRCHVCNCDDFIEMSSQQLRRGAHTDSGVPVQSFSVPALILSKHQSFDVCNNCGKCYWEGSHKKRFCEGRFARAATSTH